MTPFNLPQKKSIRVVQSACGCAKLLTDKKTQAHSPIAGTKSPMSFEEAQKRLHRELGTTTTIQAPAPVAAPATHAAKKEARPLGSRGLPKNLEKHRADHPMTFAEAQRKAKRELGVDL